MTRRGGGGGEDVIIIQGGRKYLIEVPHIKVNGKNERQKRVKPGKNEK